MASYLLAVLSSFHKRISSRKTGMIFILTWLLFTFVSGTAGGSVGSIATINTFDGHHFGPYIVKDFHSDAGDEAVAEALIAEEGSGDGAYLDIDTENGDDDPSGELPIRKNEPKNEPALLNTPDAALDDNVNAATVKVTPTPTTTKPTTTTQRSTTTKPPTTTPKPPPTPAITTPTTRSTTTTTKAASKAPPVVTPTQSPSTAENSTCHTGCQQLLHTASMTPMPNVSFIQEAETLGFSCKVTVRKGNEQFLQNLSLHWVFEGGDPPQSDCALDDQPYLAPCEGFSTRELTERNASSLSSHLVVNDLATQHTGYFKCQVHVHCCSNVLQHELSRHVTVWTADYTVHIAFMSGITAAVLLVLIAGLLLTRRAEKRSNAYKSIPNKQTQADGKQTESHLPYMLVADTDDCDSSSFSSSSIEDC